MDFSFIFLQTPAVSTPVEAVDTHVSLVELLFKGGPIMIPIVLLSLLSVYLIVERVLYIRRAMIIPSNQMQTVKDHLRRGQTDMALATLKQHNNSFSRILRVMIKKLGRPIKEIESFVETATSIEISAMNRNMNYLGVIAGIAPMLGFVGTIYGVIGIFYAINKTGVFDMNTISGGLYQKMVTSAGGLIVGLIAYTGYHLINAMIDRFATNVEEELFEFINFITDPNHED
jgi:biopolymer transport protein ExbB